MPLREFEVPVAEIFDGLLADGPMPLSKLRGRIEKDVENVARYVRFRDAVESEIESRGWYTFTAARVMLFTSVALLALGMAGTALLYPLSTKATFYFGATAFDGALVLFYASGIAKLVRRRRRTADGTAGSKALGGISALSHGLSSAAGITGCVARALGAAPRVRNRVRSSPARARGRSALPARDAVRKPDVLAGSGGAGHRRRRRRLLPARRRNRSVAQSSNPASTYARRPMRAAGRPLALVVAIAALALLVPGAAQAKSYSLPKAVVHVEIAPDGSLLVREDITFSYAGSFSGAYRDIPVRKGERIDLVQVSEGDRRYRPGRQHRAREL